MLFHFLNFSQCVSLGIKRSTKLQISKSTPKGDVLIFLNSFSRTITNGSFGLQSCFPVFVTSQILNPAYRNLNGWQVGKMLGCFYITVFLKEHCL